MGGLMWWVGMELPIYRPICESEYDCSDKMKSCSLGWVTPVIIVIIIIFVSTDFTIWLQRNHHNKVKGRKDQ